MERKNYSRQALSRLPEWDEAFAARFFSVDLSGNALSTWTEKQLVPLRYVG